MEQIKARKPAGIILSGGPRSVNQEDAPMPDPAIFELGVPILGICYGLQLMAKLRGGKVARTESAEYGGPAADHHRAGARSSPASRRSWPAG